MEKVIVNVCTYKRPVLLGKCLDSLLAQTIPADWTVEILVIDNDAASGGAGRPDFSSQPSPMEIRYIVEPQMGIPYARNAGCKESLRLGADWVIFMDDDEEALPGWFEAYHQARNTVEAAAYSGPVRYLFPAGYAEWLENKGTRDVKDGTLLDRASTNNAMVQARILQAPGLSFDTQMAFTGGSDTDFFRRLTHQGDKIVFVKDAMVSEVVLPNRLHMRWRLERQYRSSANRVYVDMKLLGVRKTTVRSAKEFLRHLVEGSLRLLTSPLGLLAGWLKFKRNAYHGFRHFAKASGIVAGFLGKHPQPYSVTDGH